jgi:hypothetical protein
MPSNCFRSSWLLLCCSVAVARGDRLFPDESLADLFHVPPAKLIFCRISKSASTPATRFILRVFDHPSWNAPTLPNVNLTSLGDLPRGAAAELLASREFVRAVIVRDPVERFTSSFADRCLKRGDDSCPVQGESRRNISAVIGELERTGTSGTACNAFFRSATSFCGLRVLFRDFIAVPYADLFAGWSRVIRELQDIPPLQRRDFALWAQQTFELRYERDKELLRSRIERRRSNYTGLATLMRRAAAQGDAVAAATLSRLCRLYKDDYALFRTVRGVADPCEGPHLEPRPDPGRPGTDAG